MAHAKRNALGSFCAWAAATLLLSTALAASKTFADDPVGRRGPIRGGCLGCTSYEDDRPAFAIGTCVGGCFPEKGDCERGCACRSILNTIVATTLASSAMLDDPIDPASRALFERLVREAPPGWAELEARCRKVHFTGQSDSSGKSRLAEGDWREHSMIGRHEYKQNGLDHLSWSTEGLVKDGGPIDVGSSYVLVANPRHAFEVKRPDSLARYVLEQITAAEVARTLQSKRYTYLTMMWGTSGSTPFGALLRSKAFHLKKIESAKQDGTELIRIEYDRVADPDGRPNAIHDAWAVFDPAAHWAAREFGYVGSNGIQYSHRYAYDRDTDRFPVLKSSSYEIKTKDSLAVFRFDFDTFEYVEVPIGEFYTPFFGIEEANEAR